MIPGVTLIETETLQALIGSIEKMELMVMSTMSELKSLKDPYMTTTEVAELTKFGEKWVQDNKEKLGFKIIGGNLRFKRKYIEAFMNEDFFHPKKRK